MDSLPGPILGSLAAHVTLGMVALVCGAFALALRKGSLWHRRFGIVFVYAMLGSLACAVPVIVAHRNLFLGLLTPFVVYLVVRGYLAAHRAGARAQRMLAAVALATSCGLILLGAFRIFHGAPAAGLPGALLGLGTLGAWLTFRDLRAPAPDRPPGSVLAHAVSMTGGYTTAVTAFTVVNFPPGMLPRAVVWLTPVTVGTALAFWWASRLRRGRVAIEIGEP
jgi:uncharacterized membrane protein